MNDESRALGLDRQRPAPWRACALAILVAVAMAVGLPRDAAAQTLAPAQPRIIKGPYLVADVKSGSVLEHHHALRPWYPASTTKLMTAYATFRAIQAGEIALDSPVLISRKAAAQPPSKMGFRPGTVLTVDNALKIIMVKSANDIALALAEAVGGSEAGFAARMNAEARRLGMDRSHFVNPHGLPDERQVTSARDMALLAQALLTEFSRYRHYYNIPAIQFGDIVMKNYNSLVSRYPGTTGMKTGFICSSGYNLVASAWRDGREVVAVVFGSYSGQDRAERAAELLDEGLSAHGLFGRARLTLANVASGAGFDEPLDMRPEICTEKRKEVLGEINEEPAFKATPKGAVVRINEPVKQSRLDPPRDMGPPILITLGVPVEAPLPRARPERELAPEEIGDTAADYPAERPVVQPPAVTTPVTSTPAVPLPGARPER